MAKNNLAGKIQEKLNVQFALGFCLAEQYQADLFTIAINDVLGIGKERCARIVERYKELSEEMSKMRKDDPVDLWEFSAALERPLKAILQERYEPPETRYKTIVRDNVTGEVLAETSFNDFRRLA